MKAFIAHTFTVFERKDFYIWETTLLQLSLYWKN